MGRQEVEELLEDARLVGGAVGPERVPLLGPVHLDDHPEQVIEAAFRVALDVEVDSRGGCWQLRRAEDVDLLLADGQRLQGVLVQLPLLLPAFALPPRPETCRTAA